MINFVGMSNKSNKSRPLFWFYILVAYVLLQFIWWSYLMIDLNNEVVLLKTELNLLKGGSPDEIISKGNELNEKLHKRWLMILGEGLVFITLLIVGIFQIRKTYIKEAKLVQQQQNFLLSVTHELKSPIASAKLQLQTLKKHELERGKQEEIINNAIKDTDRLNTLVENMLLATKVENDINSSQKEDCDISELTTNIINQSISSFNYKHKIILDIEPNIHLNVDKTSFPSIIINLFENAIKYSPEDSSIQVELKNKNGDVYLTVTDEGVGIDDSEKKTIFQKFYRIGNEETRSTKGTGLGLFIVNYLAKQHNGIVTVSNNTPKGSVFKVHFKR